MKMKDKAVTHRRADPSVVIKIWEIMDSLKDTKQTATIDRVNKAVCKMYNVDASKARQILLEAEDDGLLEHYTSLPTKSIKSELSEGYRLPDYKVACTRLDSDWYCFHCHKAGTIIACGECFRVYHEDCIVDFMQDIKSRMGLSSDHFSTLSQLESDSAKFICPVCECRPKCEYSRKQIRKLLEFATHHLKKQNLWKELLTIGYKDVTKNEYFTYRYVDLDLLQKKIKDGRYNSLDEFVFDIQLLVHDVCLLHGPYSTQADLTRVLRREIESEIKEVKICTDCYINAKAKVPDWISKPCKPPHDLIWAMNKLPTGPQSYWPAKLLLEREISYEVRFFGGNHERSNIPKTETKPFYLPADDVGVKRVGGFDRAWNEVTKLQSNLDIGYYTHSSGESDLPSSDPEFNDEVYLRPRRKSGQLSVVNSFKMNSNLTKGSSTPSQNIGLSGSEKKKSTTKNRKTKNNNTAAILAQINNTAVDSDSGEEEDKPSVKMNRSRRKPASRRRSESGLSSQISSPSPSKRRAQAKSNSSTVNKGRAGRASARNKMRDAGESDNDDEEEEAKTDSEKSDAVDWQMKEGRVKTEPSSQKLPNNKSKKSSAKRKLNESSKSPRRASARLASPSSGPSARNKAAKLDLSSTSDDSSDEPTSETRRHNGSSISSIISKKGKNQSVQSNKSLKPPQLTKSTRAFNPRKRANCKRNDSSEEEVGNGVSAADSCVVTSSGLDTIENSAPAVLQWSPTTAVKKRNIIHKATQAQTAGTSSSNNEVATCNCRSKFDLELKEVLETERTEQEEKREALNRMYEKLQEKCSSLQHDLDEAREAVERERSRAKEQLEAMEARQQEIIANTKRRQWCRNCLKEAIYHCCWNTSYCSIQCQQEHWQKEHKRVCRRKR